MLPKPLSLLFNIDKQTLNTKQIAYKKHLRTVYQLSNSCFNNPVKTYERQTNLILGDSSPYSASKSTILYEQTNYILHVKSLYLTCKKSFHVVKKARLRYVQILFRVLFKSSS